MFKMIAPLINMLSTHNIYTYIYTKSNLVQSFYCILEAFLISTSNTLIYIEY